MPTTGRASIIGGGPAGLMAAEVLADRGVHVTVYEHMPSVGRKFLLAGRSGLNLTHAEPLEHLLDRYGDARARFEPAIRAFPPDRLRAWSEGLGEPTFVGSSGRVFPTSMRATPLLRAWLDRLRAAGVRFEVRHRWTGWGPGGGPTLSRGDGSTAEVEDGGAVVLALGGASWPRVGSDGHWTEIVRAAGVDVTPLRPANCGVRVDWSPEFRDRFAGVPVKNLRASVVGASGGGSEIRGEAVITATGLEGGAIYGVSAAVRDAVERDGAATLSCDLHPDLDRDRVVARLARRRSGESGSTRLRGIGLAPVSIGILREVTSGRLPREDGELADLVKAAPVRVVGTASIDRSISTAGGIALGEVDDAFMLLRRPGTFVAGEMLDWEAPTGGYLLQACFSTAVAAANGAAAWIDGYRKDATTSSAVVSPDRTAPSM